MEFTIRAEQLFGAQSFIEPVGRVAGVAEQQHRRNSLPQKPACDVAQKAASQPLAVVFAKQVDLVQLSRKVRLVGMIIPHTLCESNEVAVLFLNDETEP